MMVFFQKVQNRNLHIQDVNVSRYVGYKHTDLVNDALTRRCARRHNDMFTLTNCIYSGGLMNIKLCDFPGVLERIHNRVRQRKRKLTYRRGLTFVYGGYYE